MSNVRPLMRSKTIAVTSSSLVSACLLLAIDKAGCALRACTEDDAAVRAELVMVPMLFVYAVASWLTVFPLIVAVGRSVRKPVAALLVSLSFGLAVALLLHQPQVDSSVVRTLNVLLPWLVVPWFAGGWLATLLWPYPPNNEKHSAAETEA